MFIASEIHALDLWRNDDPQSKRTKINKGSHHGRGLEMMSIGKKVQAFFAHIWKSATKSSCENRKLSLSHPAEAVLYETSAAKTESDPNIRTYGKFEMENHISSRKAQSFLARGRRSVVKRLSVIRDLRCFRRSTATHKPSNVKIAPYRELRQKKVALTFKIIKQFVKELKSNDPETWFALNKYDHHYLHEISSKSPDLTMPTILSGAHQCTFGTNDGTLNSKFSSTFLVLMQALETKIDASIKELTAQALKDAAENDASHARQ